MNTSFLNKDKVKFLQIKQDSIRKKIKSAVKNMTRDSVSAYVDKTCITYIHLRTLDDPTPFPHELRTY